MYRMPNLNGIAKDFKYGLATELNSKELIEQHLDITLDKYNNTYAIMDFFNYDKKVIVEVKSRRNKSTAYPTQLIGDNKYQRALKKIAEGFRVYFAWRLTDKMLIYCVNENDEPDIVYLGNFKNGEDAQKLRKIKNSECDVIKY